MHKFLSNYKLEQDNAFYKSLEFIGLLYFLKELLSENHFAFRTCLEKKECIWGNKIINPGEHILLIFYINYFDSQRLRLLKSQIFISKMSQNNPQGGLNCWKANCCNFPFPCLIFEPKLCRYKGPVFDKYLLIKVVSKSVLLYGFVSFNSVHRKSCFSIRISLLNVNIFCAVSLINLPRRIT